jgi:hypothetical protein
MSLSTMRCLAWLLFAEVYLCTEQVNGNDYARYLIAWSWKQAERKAAKRGWTVDGPLRREIEL